MPRIMPSNPPTELSETASIKNWVRISRPCAPTAIRVPISRVRSVTLTNMMFMMPMPPTTSDTPAIAPSNPAMTSAVAVAAPDALHRAGVRHDDDIVLVGPLNAEAFRSEHAANDKWYVLNPQGLANGIIVAEDLRGGCLSDNTHLIRAAHILRGERSALGQRPLPNVEIIR